MYWKEQLQITNPKITKCSQPCNNSQYEQLNDQSIQVADNTKMSYISKTCITYGIILSLMCKWDTWFETWENKLKHAEVHFLRRWTKTKT